MDNIRPIRTPADYEAALKAVSPYFDLDEELDPDSEGGMRFEMMVTLIHAYEARQFPVSPPDPVEAIKFRMDQLGLTPRDLEPMIGRSNRVYEILNRRRPLTLAMIRRLHAGLGISAESLIRLPSGA